MENLYLVPGRFLLDLIAVYAPPVASWLGLESSSEPVVLTIVLSTLLWLIMCATIWTITRVAFHARRIGEAVVYNAFHSVANAFGSARTWLLCRYRGRFSAFPDNDSAVPVETDIGSFDLAVLQAAAEAGPGYTTSAAELANRFNMLPSRFVQSLQRLHRNQMIDTTIGSTDGFDNYRVTMHGAAFADMCRNRTSPPATSPSPQLFI